MDADGALVMPATQDSSAIVTLMALPSLNASPNAPVLSVPPGGNVAQSFTIRNDGSAPMRDITITPGTDLPAWVYLGTPGTIPVIDPGQSVSFSLFASPPADETRSIVGGHLTVSAAGGLSAAITLTTRLEASQKDGKAADARVKAGLDAFKVRAKLAHDYDALAVALREACQPKPHHFALTKK